MNPADAKLAIDLAAFEASEPRIWKHHPHITEAEDQFTDGWACEQVSRQAATFLKNRGHHVVILHGEDAEHPLHSEHYWIRVGRLDIDFGARVASAPPQAHRRRGHAPPILRADGTSGIPLSALAFRQFQASQPALRKCRKGRTAAVLR